MGSFPAETGGFRVRPAKPAQTGSGAPCGPQWGGTVPELCKSSSTGVLVAWPSKRFGCRTIPGLQHIRHLCGTRGPSQRPARTAGFSCTVWWSPPSSAHSTAVNIALGSSCGAKGEERGGDLGPGGFGVRIVRTERACQIHPLPNGNSRGRRRRAG